MTILTFLAVLISFDDEVNNNKHNFYTFLQRLVAGSILDVTEFFSIYLVLPAALWARGPLRLFNRNEYLESSLGPPRGKERPAHKAENLTAIWADYLENVEASTSHNPMGLHGLLKG
jgi:hypothetical protein